MFAPNTVSKRLKLSSRVALAAIAVTSALLFAVPPQASEGQPTQSVLRVEEDWKLVLLEPDGLQNAPQFHSVMSPSGDLDSLYAQVTWNYRE